MKKFLLLASLCMITVITQAQLRIKNNTDCQIVVTPFCYNPANCTPVLCGAGAVTVAGKGTALLPICGCAAPSLQGYAVCWTAPGCAGTCVAVSNVAPPPPCLTFPPSSAFPPCSATVCNTGPYTVSFDAAGNLVVQ